MQRWMFAAVLTSVAAGCASPQRPCPECEPCRCASAAAATPSPVATETHRSTLPSDSAPPTQPVPIDLPRASTGEKLSVGKIRIDASGDVFLDEGTLPADDAGILVWARTRIADDPGLRVTIAADRDAKHGTVLRVVDLLKQSGVNRIAFATVAIDGRP